MRIKSKVSLGVAFLFFVILAVGGLGLYHLNQLSNDSKNIIRNNYETLIYTKGILSAMQNPSAGSLDSLEAYLRKQEANITEPGEREATLDLRNAFERLRQFPGDSTASSAIRIAALKIQELNLQAIIYKNEIAQTTAKDASTYVVIIVSIFAIIAFSFIVNFPGYVADPIARLTNSIQSIANKNYEERLHFDRKDEFEELAEAFNQMAEKLDEYEHSNLSNLLFEKKRIETIINRMSDPVIGLDDNKKVVFANEVALSLLSLSEEKVVGRYAPDVAVENDLMRTLIRQNGSVQENEALFKIVLHGKENYFKREVINISYSPTGEKQTVSIGQVILLKNVTPFKELDLAKTNFIATISHELKTPIASMQMCVKLLQDNRVGDLNNEQENVLRTLNEEVVRLSKITHELLDLTQVETGNIKLSLESVEPQRIIQFAVEATHFLAERKGLHLEEAVSSDLPQVKADVDKSSWVLVNLLTNAIRYSPENDKVKIHCEREGSFICFSVQDFGTGIEEKYIGRLFERFFQIPGTTSGTGLGLAISKEFIEAQGGSIWAESEFGKGSKFSFRLPVA